MAEELIPCQAVSSATDASAKSPFCEGGLSDESSLFVWIDVFGMDQVSKAGTAGGIGMAKGIIPATAGSAFEDAHLSSYCSKGMSIIAALDRPQLDCEDLCFCGVQISVKE